MRGTINYDELLDLEDDLMSNEPAFRPTRRVNANVRVTVGRDRRRIRKLKLINSTQTERID